MFIPKSPIWRVKHNIIILHYIYYITMKDLREINSQEKYLLIEKLIEEMISKGFKNTKIFIYFIYILYIHQIYENKNGTSDD